jgi:hypothetical protein
LRQAQTQPDRRTLRRLDETAKASRVGSIPANVASAREQIADFWDEHTNAWLDGRDPMPDPLPRWYESYAGRGAGQVSREAFAEPYGGDLRGEPRIVILGLNPGSAQLDFQGRDGIFANEIRASHSYSTWAAGHPYLGETWSRAKGDNRYGRSRLRFAREWLDDDDLSPAQMLTFELYPWHSTSVTASMAPPVDVIERFIWEPIAETSTPVVFAFGKPWLRICENLGLEKIGHWGRGGADLGSPVVSRAAVAFALPSGQWVVVCWQAGYAGPFGREDALRLRDHIGDARGTATESWKDNRFLAPPPTIIPTDASRAEELKLRFPVLPPAKGTRLRAEYDELVKHKKH